MYPDLIALVTLVSLAADPNQITQQVQSCTVGLAPIAETRSSSAMARVGDQFPDGGVET
ncbi:MAG: hypothetical protein ACRDRX_24535 [Pseudonocardiaceae bacterium]